MTREQGIFYYLNRLLVKTINRRAKAGANFEMSENYPQCFGKGAASSGNSCDSCEFQESCEVCRNMPDSKINRPLGFVSYDKYDYSREVADEQVDDRQDDDASDPGYSLHDMKQVLGFLLRIDDYSLALLSEIITKNKSTASSVAKDLAVSRQAIHRKIRDSCLKFPELREVFKLYLYRCKSIIRRKNGRDLKNKHNNREQPELKFDA